MFCLVAPNAIVIGNIPKLSFFNNKVLPLKNNNDQLRHTKTHNINLKTRKSIGLLSIKCLLHMKFIIQQQRSLSYLVSSRPRNSFDTVWPSISLQKTTHVQTFTSSFIKTTTTKKPKHTHNNSLNLIKTHLQSIFALLPFLPHNAIKPLKQ